MDIVMIILAVGASICFAAIGTAMLLIVIDTLRG